MPSDVSAIVQRLEENDRAVLERLGYDADHTGEILRELSRSREFTILDEYGVAPEDVSGYNAAIPHSQQGPGGTLVAGQEYTVDRLGAEAVVAQNREAAWVV